jgi:hypothetical protein
MKARAIKFQKILPNPANDMDKSHCHKAQHFMSFFTLSSSSLYFFHSRCTLYMANLCLMFPERRTFLWAQKLRALSLSLLLSFSINHPLLIRANGNAKSLFQPFSVITRFLSCTHIHTMVFPRTTDTDDSHFLISDESRRGRNNNTNQMARHATNELS